MSFTNQIRLRAEREELEQRFWTVAEVARRLGFSTTAVYREIRRGHLRAYSLCGRLRIAPGAVDDWVAERAVPASNVATEVASTAPRPRPARGLLRPLLEQHHE